MFVGAMRAAVTTNRRPGTEAAGLGWLKGDRIMKTTVTLGTLTVKKIDQRVAAGFEQIERKVGPSILWSAPGAHI